MSQDAAATPPAPPDGADAGTGILPVVLYEDGAGRLVVVDARRPDALPADAASLLRIGRARIVARHLTGVAAMQLADAGHVRVEGPDALNVLLAFAGGG